MLKPYIFFVSLLFSLSLQAQAFKAGEILNYRVHYGFLNAGEATLKVQEGKYNSKPHYHIVGTGKSTGAVRAFFKVNNRFESYIQKDEMYPSKFIRKTREGNHRKDRVLTFDQDKHSVIINDRRGKTFDFKTYNGNVQDLISAFYKLRTHKNSDFVVGKFIMLNIFLDGETYPFKLKVIDRETIETKFGDIRTIQVKPYVQSGRVFKEEESVTMWISDDANLIPVKIKAELAVGALEADLNSFKNLKNQIVFK